MKIVAGQIELIVGQSEINFKKVIEYIEKAKEVKADLVIFPNNVFGADYDVSGAWAKELISYNDKIKALSDEIGIIWGNYSYDDEIFADFPVFSPLFAFNKEYLDINEVITFKEKRINVLSYDLAYFEADDISDPYDILVFLSDASYYRGINEKRLEVIANLNQDKLIICCSGIGTFDDGKNVFMLAGGSMMIQGKEIIAQSPNFKEELLEVGNISEFEKGYLLPLIYALRSFDKVVFNQRFNWVIGLSGGLDSSISAALLQIAFGSERVKGYYLKSKHNSLTTYNNAKSLAKGLDIFFKSVDIQSLVDDSVNKVETADEKLVEGLTLENIQARIRGHLLSTFAANNNALVINNGNKLEVALGYCTLYGDTIGAIAPLGDLLKVQLFALAKEINDYFNSEIIPVNLIPEVNSGKFTFGFAPSAELKDNQVDPMKWGYHDLLLDYIIQDRLVELLRDYLSDEIYQKEIGKYLKAYQLNQPKIFIDDLNWFINNIKRSAFKKIQGVPIISVTTTTFGSAIRSTQYNWQHNQVIKDLIEAILNK